MRPAQTQPGGREQGMREPFFDKIAQRPLVCDGAMGTMLYAKGISLKRCFDELNLTMP